MPLHPHTSFAMGTKTHQDRARHVQEILLDLSSARIWFAQQPPQDDDDLDFGMRRSGNRFSQYHFDKDKQDNFYLEGLSDAIGSLAVDNLADLTKLIAKVERVSKHTAYVHAGRLEMPELKSSSGSEWVSYASVIQSLQPKRTPKINNMEF